jgi:hypothetical protein
MDKVEVKMKKTTLRLIAFILMMCFLIVNVNVVEVKAATGAQQTYKVTLDGKAVSIPVVSKNGTLYFQLEKLIKSAGWTGKVTKCTYSSNLYSVDIQKGEYSSYFSSDDDDISMNGSSYSWRTKLDKKMIITNNALYAPLKFVTGVLRLDVTTKANQITLKTMKNHTLLVYVVASNLESDIGPGNPEGAATADLNELMSVGSTSKVNVVVQTGGTNKWNNNIIKGTSVQRWYVQKGNMKKLADLGQKNMGDPKDLQGFIEWGMATYPAETYTLVLWDHGGGPLFGYGFDELSKDKLSIKELKTAFSNAYKTTNKKFATVAFDACIMNSLEIADMLTPYASAMVASKVSLPAHGFDYSALVPLLEKDTDPEYPRFGYNLVDQFKEYATKKGTMDNLQLSCINLAELKKFMVLFNKFTEKLSKDMDSNPLLAYDLAVARSEDCDFKDEDITGDGNDLTELSMLLLQMKDSTNGKYNSDIDKLRDALNLCEAGVTGKNVPLNGMSIYMPLTQFSDATYEKDYFSLYQDIGFSKSYTSLIEKYYKRIMQDDSKIAITKNVTAGSFSNRYEANDALTLEVSSDSLKKISKVTTVTEIYNKELGRNIINASFPSYFFRDRTDIQENSHVFKLNGNYISMLYSGQIADGLKLFTVPIMLNGNEANLFVIREGFGETYFIAGVQIVQENESGMSTKRTIELKSTDIIEPIFLTRDTNGAVEKSLSKNKFELGNGEIEGIDSLNDVKEKYELYYNIELFNQKVIETNHVKIDSSNN